MSTVFCWKCGERLTLNAAGEPVGTCPRCDAALRRETVTPMTPREVAAHTAEQTRRELAGGGTMTDERITVLLATLRDEGRPLTVAAATEIERLRGQLALEEMNCARMADAFSSESQRAEAAERELAEMKARTCATCASETPIVDTDGCVNQWRECRNRKSACYGRIVSQFHNFGCTVHEPRPPAADGAA
jgi:hypothetical protein